MANNGKARRTGIVKTEKMDGAVTGTTHYTMLTPAPSGTVVPTGWVAVTEDQVKSMTLQQYQESFRSFLNLLSVPATTVEDLVNAAEYEDLSACPLPVVEPVYNVWLMPVTVDEQVSQVQVIYTMKTDSPVDLKVNIATDDPVLSPEAIFRPTVKADSPHQINLFYNRQESTNYHVFARILDPDAASGNYNVIDSVAEGKFREVGTTIINFTDYNPPGTPGQFEPQV